jgi:hypothetical protein
MSASSNERFRLLADRLHAQRLWAHEDLFASAFGEAADLLYERSYQAYNARRFVDLTYINLITRPGDLVALCRRLPEQLQLPVVEAYVRHELVPQDILAAMGGAGDVYRYLPHGGWIETPLYAYGATRLNAEPRRRFDLHELLPYGAAHDLSTSRALLGSALDSDQLTDQARAAALSPDEAALPDPDLYEGDRVHVETDGTDHTPRDGDIRDKAWHYKSRQWYYFIRDTSGRNLTKRYFASDLSPAGA